MNNEMNLMNNEEFMVEEPVVVEEVTEDKGNCAIPVMIGAAAIGAAAILYKKVLEPKIVDMAVRYVEKKTKAMMEDLESEIESEVIDNEVE